MKSFEEVFKEAQNYCLNTLGMPEVIVSTWISTLEPVRYDFQEGEGKAYFNADSDFAREAAESYQSKLEEALEAVTGFPTKMSIKTKPETESEIDDEINEIERRHAELQKSYKNADYEYTFDTFITGGSNEFAYAACKAVAQNSPEKMNPLFIYGDSGLGKTHLLMAICHEYKQLYPDRNVIYVTSEEFTNELISCMTKKTTEDFHNKYRNADILLVDDIQFFTGKERMQEEFFHTFNTLHSEGKQIVISSDRPPKEVKTLTDRLRSRFESGILADISSPDYETRVAIIRRKADLLDLDIPDDVADFIAMRLKTNIRQLEGAVKKLKALKHLAGSSPSISMAQSVIREILRDEQPVEVSVEKIITEVAKIYGVNPEDIRSNKRASQISTARKVSIYIVRNVTNMPLAAIGAEFGGRDHSTIVYAINSIEDQLSRDQNLKNVVEDIEKGIKNNMI